MFAFLGTGLLGGNFVKAALKRGEKVQVWNRSPEKAKALEADGAKAFRDPTDAVRGAERVHLALSDDAAVDETLEKARGGIGPSAVIVDHTTTSPTGTAERAKRWAARGLTFHHAPVFMGPQNALEATGIMLSSGDKALHDKLAPALEKMTGKLVYLGPEADRAAKFKLFGNMFLMFMTTGVAEVLAFAKAVGVKPADAAALFDAFNPGTTLGVRVKRMLDADFANPSWELSMARKDARLMIEEAARHQAHLAVLPAIAAEMDRYIARGHGKDDWTVIAKDALTP